MADNDQKHKDENESLSATGMFLRSFAADPPPPANDPQPFSAKAESIPPAISPPAENAGPTEFTRMFRSIPPAEPAPTPSPSPAAPAPPPSSPNDGEFTRAFVVPSSVRAQPPSQSAPPKMKGFSTPGVSDSASAEGSFTRIFRPALQDVPSPPASGPSPERPESLPPSIQPPTPRPEPAIFPAVSRPETNHPSAGVTELFRALSAADEKHPAEHSYRAEPTPAIRPYTEPTLLPRAEKLPETSPSAAGVTALLNRLTAETPLMPPAPLPTQQPPIHLETPPIGSAC